MQSWLLQFTSLSGEVVQFLFAWSWRALLLLLVVWFLIKLCRFRSPAIRFRVWLLGLGFVAGLPLAAAAWQNFALPHHENRVVRFVVEMPDRAITASRGVTEPVTDSGSTVKTPAGRDSVPQPQRRPSLNPLWFQAGAAMVLVIWVVGVMIVGKRLFSSYRKLNRAAKQSRPLFVGEWGCSMPPAFERVVIKASAEVASPMLIGFFRPTILLPDDLAEWTTVDERQAILLHEWIHIQRRDYLANSLQAVLGAILFFHPLVRYACNQLRQEMEYACDEAVLNEGVRSSSYVDSILKVAEKCLQKEALYQPAFATRKNLERRVNMILKDRYLPLSSAKRWALLVLPAILLLAAVWILIPNRSSAAQQNKLKAAEREGNYLTDHGELFEKELSKLDDRSALLRHITNEDGGKMLEDYAAAYAMQVLQEATEMEIHAKRFDHGEGLLEVTAEESFTDDEGLVIYSNVVVKTPGFTFKSPHAEGRNQVIRISEIIQIEHNGQTYYTKNSIAIAERGNVLLYVVSKYDGLSKERPIERKETVELVLDGSVELSEPPPPPPPPPKPGIKFSELLQDSKN